MKESNNDKSIGYIKGNNMSLYGTNYVLDSQRMPTQLKGVMQYSIPAVDVVTKKRINDEKELLNDIKAGKTISLYDKNSHVVESCLFKYILRESLFSAKSTNDSIEKIAKKLAFWLWQFNGNFFERIDGEIKVVNSLGQESLQDFIMKRFKNGTFLEDINKRFEKDMQTEDLTLKEYSLKVWDRIFEILKDKFEQIEAKEEVK